MQMRKQCTFHAPFEKGDVKAGSRHTLVNFNGLAVPDKSSDENGVGGGAAGVARAHCQQILHV